MYLIDNGLGCAEHPDWGSWGGRYELYQPRTERWFIEPETRPIWTDAQDEVMAATAHGTQATRPRYGAGARLIRTTLQHAWTGP